MMDETTLIIMTENNQKVVKKTFEKLNRMVRKHPNIRKILWIDNASTDKTVEILKELVYKNADRNEMIYSFSKKARMDLLREAIRSVSSLNVVFVEPQFYTRFRSILCQIKLLRRVAIVVPGKDGAADYDSINFGFKLWFLKAGLVAYDDWHEMIFQICVCERYTLFEPWLNHKKERF